MLPATATTRTVRVARDLERHRAKATRASTATPPPTTPATTGRRLVEDGEGGSGVVREEEACNRVQATEPFTACPTKPEAH